MMDVAKSATGVTSTLALVVLAHGIAAAIFALVFLLDAAGLSLPLVSLQAQHPDFLPSQYATAASLWIAVAIGTFASYEIFLLPYLAKEYHAKLKKLFVAYHVAWCIVTPYIALMPGSSWSAWITVAVIYGFTLAGYLAPSE